MTFSYIRYVFYLLIALIICLLPMLIGMHSPGFAQTIATVTPTPGITPTPTVSSTSIIKVDEATYGILLSHFEKVSISVLNIAKWVVLIVGGSGGIGGYLLVKHLSSLKSETADLETEVQNITQKIVTQKMELEQISDKLKESRELNQEATSRLQYFLETRDRNCEVRIRAVQQLGASNDISAASILIERLEEDENENVKMEAAYWLTTLISENAEQEIFYNGVQALLNGASDDSEKVREEAINAIGILVCNGNQLPRSVTHRLQEIIKTDKCESVNQAANQALEYIKKQQENKLDHANKPKMG